MMPAAKHGDPQIGVDIHLCIVPPGTPVPLPTPHMSVVFDPFDYIPIIGATITVSGMKRATAGTAGIVVHIPPGFPFAPKLPDKDDEVFMGSATVVADGDPMSHIAHPVLSCQAVGMAAPFRLRKKGGPRVMVLPTVFNLAIPTTVFVGGPPTISMMGMAVKGAFSALGKFAKSGVFKRIRQKLFKNMKPGILKCVILRAEPVNILSGAVSVEQEDFTLPGRLPVQWLRSYNSASRHRGACGQGWETLLDIRLQVLPGDGGVMLHGPEVGPLSFSQLPLLPGDAGTELELSDGARLTDHGDEWRVRTKDDRVYHFPRRLAATEDPDGSRCHPISRISDHCGNALQIDYRGGRPVSITESAGRLLALSYSNGLLAAVTLVDPATRAEHVFVRYQYDASGDLVSVLDALGQPYGFAYEQHHLVRHTDRRGLSFHYAFDTQGPDGWRVVHAWGDGGLYDYRFEYLDAVNERRITDSLGHVSLVRLDERGLPVSEIDALGGMTVYEYDDAGRTTAVTDPGGHRNAYDYDERGNLLALVRPDGMAVATRFNADDRPVQITDPSGQAWQQRFDARGLMVEQVSPLGHISRYEYDAFGQLSAYVNPRQARTGLQYDLSGHLAQITDALGHSTLFAHDALGNLVAKGDALDRRTQYRYDAKGRLLAVKLPSGSVMRCGYDAEDNLTEYVDENGATTRLEYFGQGELARRIQPDGHTVDYLYNTEEQLVGVRNQRGETYQLKRDALGRIVEEVDYWGQPRRYGYDGSGHLRWSQDPLGRRIAYDCDPLGRIVKKAFAHPLGGDRLFEETFAYDANGNLTATGNEHVAVTREFDVEGRLTKEVQAHTAGQRFAIDNAYDAVGNRTQRSTASSVGAGHVTEYAYDLLDQSIGMRIDGGPPMRMQRDALGQITAEELAPGLTRHFRYNADGLMTEQAVAKDGKSLFATRYDYDLVGNLTQRHDSQWGVDRYVYDPMGRILDHIDPRGQLERFFNDPAGDRLVTGVVESQQQTTQMLGMGDTWRREGEYLGVQYRFDRAGNMTRKLDGEVRLDLAWDANQRLIASRRTTRDSLAITTYGYDPLGRRLFKETSGAKTWFGWDGDFVAADHLSSGRREFVYQGLTHIPAVQIWIEGSSDLQRFYITDVNGFANRMLDVSGSTLWAANYSTTGRLELHAGHESDNPLRHQGQYFDEETGLSYCRHRYFDHDCVIFVSTDPMGLIAGPNLYLYAPNYLGWADPMGLACGAAIKQNSRGRWIDARGKFAARPNVATILPLKGKSVGHVEEILQSRGYTRTNPANPKNQRWVHPDGSEVQIHAYGNANTGPFKAGNNAHAHKSLGRHGQAGTTELADNGMTAVNTHSSAAHIGLKNPADFPAIAGRCHGT